MSDSMPKTFVSPINSLISKETIIIGISFLVIYLFWLMTFVGIRVDHYYFLAILIFGYIATPTSRKFIMSMVFFWLFWIIYDAMRVWPNYLVNPIHIQELYEAEKSIFGFTYNGNIVTPNEWFKIHEHKIWDVLSGVFYLTWVPLPIAYAIYLFFNDKSMMLRFTACFLFANLVGFVIYYLYPAAAPWYVYYHGFEQNFEIGGSSAQLANFDEVVGMPIFEGMYEKNANVFAAIPSLHSAYPVVLFYYGMKKRYKIASVIFFLDIIGIWFAAVYTMHHYIIDVLLGAMCAIIAIFVFEQIIMKSNFKNILNRYVNFIS